MRPLERCWQGIAAMELILFGNMSSFGITQEKLNVCASMFAQFCLNPLPTLDSSRNRLKRFISIDERRRARWTIWETNSDFAFQSSVVTIRCLSVEFVPGIPISLPAA